MNQSAIITLLTLSLMTGGLASQPASAHEGPSWVDGCTMWDYGCSPMTGAEYGPLPPGMAMMQDGTWSDSLTRAQRKKIREITDELRPQMRELWDRISDQKHALYDAVRDKNDDKDVDALTKALGELIAQNIELNVRLRTGVDKVLTPAQRRHYRHLYSWSRY